jgi:hypothetical protein
MCRKCPLLIMPHITCSIPWLSELSLIQRLSCDSDYTMKLVSKETMQKLTLSRQNDIIKLARVIVKGNELNMCVSWVYVKSPCLPITM